MTVRQLSADEVARLRDRARGFVSKAMSEFSELLDAYEERGAVIAELLKLLNGSSTNVRATMDRARRSIGK